MRFPRKIYAIRHNITNRVYVGSSANVDVRIKAHMCALRSHKHPVEDMQSDFDKYGEDFSIAVLEEVQKYEDKDREYAWMQTYQSFMRGIGYNYKDKHEFVKRVNFDEYELRRLIQENNITYPQIAERLGITTAQFNYRLRNAKLGICDIKNLIELLGIKNPSKIFFED